MEVWKGLDVVTATIIYDYFFELLYVFSGTINNIVTSLIVVACYE